jgi:hypothetical protein
VPGYDDVDEENKEDEPEGEAAEASTGPMKRSQATRNVPGQERCVFHDKSMTDYQGWTYVRPGSGGAAAHVGRGHAGLFLPKGVRVHLDGRYPSGVGRKDFSWDESHALESVYEYEDQGQIGPGRRCGCHVIADI